MPVKTPRQVQTRAAKSSVSHANAAAVTVMAVIVANATTVASALTTMTALVIGKRQLSKLQPLKAIQKSSIQIQFRRYPKK